MDIREGKEVKTLIALSIESSRSRGMGHLFRSFLIIDFLKKKGIEFIYLINDDPRSLRVLEERNISYIIVDYYDQDSLWEHRIIEENHVSVWLNDKFETPVWMAKHIREKGVYLALIDDIGPGEEFANVNFVSLISFSKSEFKCKNTLIGMSYTILNDEIEKYRRTRNELKRIIISFGGSDPYNHTTKVVKCLLKSGYDFDLTLGPNNECGTAIREMGISEDHIFRDVPSLIELFSEYDLAITGGGITPCEANAAGLPCIIIASAPHEINTGKALQSYGGCVYAGNYEGWDRTALLELNKLDIENMSRKGMQTFDLNALDRIFSLLATYIIETSGGDQ